jgi:hypothetical protein
VSEFAYGASEPADGAIHRDDPRFQDLVENHNTDIIFRDEERDGSDRIMTQVTYSILFNIYVFIHENDTTVMGLCSRGKKYLGKNMLIMNVSIFIIKI